MKNMKLGPGVMETPMNTMADQDDEDFGNEHLEFKNWYINYFSQI